MFRNTTTLGLISILGWCVFSALARIITSNVTQEIEPSVLCFYTFLFAETVFFLLNFSSFKDILLRCKEVTHRRNIFWLNVTTFGAWFFLIYPLKYIDPAMVSAITLGLGPLATLILGLFIYKYNCPTIFDTSIAILLFLVIIFIISLCINRVAIQNQPTVAEIISAIASCFIVGLATAAGNLYAKKLSDNKFSPTTVLRCCAHTKSLF